MDSLFQFEDLPLFTGAPVVTTQEEARAARQMRDPVAVEAESMSDATWAVVLEQGAQAVPAARIRFAGFLRRRPFRFRSFGDAWRAFCAEQQE